MATTSSTTPDLEPIDIASIMNQGPLAFGNPFMVEQEGARVAGKPRCGICLFHLVPGAKPSNVDADEDLSLIENTWVRSARKEFQVSAARGCTFCGNILNFALGLGATELSFKQSSRWRGISMIKEDETVENFVFLVPLSTTDQDLETPVHKSICRGIGSASIKCTSDNEVLNQARSWWERCTQEHGCVTETCSYTPRRLLRLDHGADETATVVRLVEDLTEPVKYVALSHRWSEETKAVSLVDSNRCERKEKGVVSSELPRLIQDTIQVLRQFGIQYLWVDCMCIIQDGIADWKREAGSMASIYKNATFAISAMHCRGSNETLFSDPGKTPAGFVGELPGGVPVHLEHHIAHPFRYLLGSVEFRRREDFDGAMDSSLDLLCRGWVYQEVLLSPRTLYFLANEIMWRCREYNVCQCARYDFDETLEDNFGLQVITDIAGPLYYSTRGSEQIGSRPWGSIVGQYSSKNLTYPQDRLPALAGIAEAYGKATGWKYICGLWQEDLQTTFAWCRGYADAAERPSSNVPTWSWASTATEVRMGAYCAQEVEFESWNIIYNDEGDPYIGDVKEAVLNLSGHVFPAKLVPPGCSDQLEDITSSAVYGEWGVSILSRFKAWLFEDFLLTEAPDSVETDVLCLILDLSPGSCDCLVLRGVKENIERYERLGRIWISAESIQSDWRARWNVSKRRLALV